MTAKTPEKPTRQLLSRAETAAVIGCFIRKLDTMIEEKELRAVRLGRLVKIREEDLAAFIASLPAA